MAVTRSVKNSINNINNNDNDDLNNQVMIIVLVCRPKSWIILALGFQRLGLCG